jgi:hypothetical protein
MGRLRKICSDHNHPFLSPNTSAEKARRDKLLLAEINPLLVRRSKIMYVNTKPFSFFDSEGKPLPPKEGGAFKVYGIRIPLEILPKTATGLPIPATPTKSN